MTFTRDNLMMLFWVGLALGGVMRWAYEETLTPETYYDEDADRDPRMRSRNLNQRLAAHEAVIARAVKQEKRAHVRRLLAWLFIALIASSILIWATLLLWQ